MNMIRPVSDLRNNFAEISKTVHENAQPVKSISSCMRPSAKRSCPANAIPPRMF